MTTDLIARPAAVFVQLWLHWRWIPLVTNSSMGIAFSWGPVLLGYIRSDSSALRAREQSK